MLFLMKSLKQVDMNPWLVAIEKKYFSDLRDDRIAYKIGLW